MNATSQKSYNEEQIIAALRAGNPVFGRGNAGEKKILWWTKYTNGHAWVYDGCIRSVVESKPSYFVHCNWGWGGYKNGYYLSKVFNTADGADIYESGDVQTGNGYDFKYNLEYSIISR